MIFYINVLSSIKVTEHIVDPILLLRVNRIEKITK